MTPGPPLHRYRLLARLISFRYRDEVMGDLVSEMEQRRAATFLPGLAFLWMVAHVIRSAVATRWSRSPGLHWRISVFSEVARDASFALRGFRKAPGFLIGSTATLAIGIGVTTAVHALATRVLAAPLPVRAPEQLVQLTETSTYPEYLNFSAERGLFEGLAASTVLPVSLGDADPPGRARASFVSGTYFDVIGVSAALGRVPNAADDQAGRPPVTVLSHHLWKQAFGGRHDLIGRTILVNARTIQVIGIMPAGFRGTSLVTPADLWLPLRNVTEVPTGLLATLPLFEQSNVAWLRMIGRRPVDVAEGQWDAAWQNVVARLYPTREKEGLVRRAAFLPITTSAVGGGSASSTSRILLLLAGVALLSLLIACANLAILSLHRGLARAREIQLRLALGAGRWRIGRQLMVEQALIAMTGAVAGWWVAHGTIGMFSTYELPGGLRMDALDLSINVWIVVGGATIGMLTGLMFGAAPTLGRREAVMPSPGGNRVTSTQRLRSVLIGGQAMVCVILLASGAVLHRATREVLSIDTGFDTARISLTTVEPSLERYDMRRYQDFRRRVLARVSAVPGVTVAWTTAPPLSSAMAKPHIEIEGHQASTPVNSDLVLVSADYFNATGVGIQRGREFLPSDALGGPRVAVVSEAFAARFFEGRDVIGGRIVLGPAFRRAFETGDEWATIVGVANNAIHGEVQQAPLPLVYLPMDQYPTSGLIQASTLVVRSDEPRAALRMVRSVIGQLDPRLPLQQSSLEDRVGRQLLTHRLILTMLGLLGGGALLLSVVGVYSVCAVNAAHRRKEVAVRLALGATPGNVTRAVMRQSAIAMCAGIVAGLPLVFWIGTFAGRLLFISPTRDLMTPILVATLLAGVGLFASFVPARLASRAPVNSLLRQD